MKRSRALLFALLLIGAMLLSACSAGGASTSANKQEASGADADTAHSALEAPQEAGGTGLGTITELESLTQGGSVYQNPDVKLIRTEELALETTSFDETISQLAALVGRYEGYYETANIYSGALRSAGAVRSGEFVIRIPAQQYEAFLQETGKISHVKSCYQSTQDIGESYYDTQTRLETQRTKHERLLLLLDQAEDMKTILDLEDALSETEYQIDAFSSTLNRYDSLVGYATLNVSLEEVIELTEVAEVSSPSFVQRISNGFSASVQGLVDGVQGLIVWIAYHFFGLIFLCVLGGAAAVVTRRFLKRKKAAVTPPEEEKKEE